MTDPTEAYNTLLEERDDLLKVYDDLENSLCSLRDAVAVLFWNLRNTGSIRIESNEPLATISGSIPVHELHRLARLAGVTL